MAADPAYLAEARRLTMGVNFMHGRDLQTIAAAVLATPPGIIEKFREAATPR